MKSPQKTYWHLAGERRVPTEYEIASSRLLYYPSRGFEVDVPLGDWYERHQRKSAFACSDWELFADPRQTTYARYTETQSHKEIYVEALMQRMEVRTYDETLSSSWRRELALFLSALRFPCHGLQMAASYVGSMAPASRIAIALAMQAADEMRRVQWFSYRLKLLQNSLGVTDLDAAGRALWQEDETWQPLRRLVETLLVTYDWGEAFVALNLVIKPALDGMLSKQLAARAERAGDHLFAQLLSSLDEDCQWHAAWSEALRQVACDSADTSAAVEKWRVIWGERVQLPLQVFA